MKKLILATLLFGLTSGIAIADGFYEYIPYYNNDPFTFCTYGVPEDCWLPISKELGTYTVVHPYCFNSVSALMFARVCPKAFPMGGSSAKVSSSSKRDNADLSP